MLRKSVLALAALLALTGCGSSAASKASGGSSSACTTPLKFTFRLNFVLDDEQVPYYTALDKGWYRDACLDPQIQPGRGSNDTVQLVANGSADLGVADSVSVIAAQAKGLDLTAVGVVYQHNPTALLIRKSVLSADQAAARAPRLTMLYGKTYGAVVQASPFLFWKALAKAQKLDLDQVHQVAISAPGFAEMATGKVDFIATFAPTAPVLEGQGVPLKVLGLEDYGQKAYGLSYIGNSGFLSAHPDAVRAFLRVNRRAVDYTNKNPEEGVRELCKANPAICGDQNALATNVQEQKLTIPLYDNLSSGKPFFCGYAAPWKATQDLLRDAGTITEEPDVAKSLTNRYLDGC